MNITKSQLINTISQKLPHWKTKEVKRAADKVVAFIADALCKKARVEFREFGSFSIHHRRSHSARNPKTGEKVITAPTEIPRFKPAKVLQKQISALSAIATSLQEEAE